MNLALGCLLVWFPLATLPSATSARDDIWTFSPNRGALMFADMRIERHSAHIGWIHMAGSYQTSESWPGAIIPILSYEATSTEVSLQEIRPTPHSLSINSARPSITLVSKSSRLSNPKSRGSISLGSENDVLASHSLSFTLRSADPFQRSVQIEVEIPSSKLRAVLTLSPSGGLALQDSHTVVATLDPLLSFGSRAFGSLRVRAVYPVPLAPRIHNEHEPPSMIQVDSDGKETITKLPDPGIESFTSEWLPLATLVRLPTLTQLACPSDVTAPCTLAGVNLFLIQSLASNALFNDPVEIPDDFTGTTLRVKHVTNGVLYIKLRDDPDTVDTATVPSRRS